MEETDDETDRNRYEPKTIDEALSPNTKDIIELFYPEPSKDLNESLSPYTKSIINDFYPDETNENERNYEETNEREKNNEEANGDEFPSELPTGNLTVCSAESVKGE